MIKTVKTIDNTIEEQICTAMIISTEFLNDVSPIFKPNYIKNSFAKIICFWCMDHFKSYKESPGKHIRDIYVTEAETNLSKEDKEIIGEFLDKLSKRYSEDQHINHEYIKDNAIEYFRKRELDIRVEQARHYLELNNVEKAEEQFSEYRKVAFNLSGWFNPFDPKEVIEVFDDKDEGVFALPGSLGRMVGKIERGWFVAILAPFKRGKTFALQEFAVRAITQRLKVVFISLEMKKKNLKERLYRRLTGLGSRTGDDVFLYPIFDCLANQNGTCDRDERTNHINLIPEGSSEKPEFDTDMEYRACSYCRDHMIKDYQAASWFETVELPPFSFQSTKKKTKALENMYGDNLRMITYPRFSAGIEDIKRDLLILEQDNFIPDMILIDYADILKLGKGEKRNQIDDIWKELAAAAAQKHCIVVTASQGTRGSIYKEDMSQDDLAEWIGKLAHVDIFLGLNQTKKEKKEKLLRIGVLVHRHREVDESIQATILQQLEIGQFLLDTHLTRSREGKHDRTGKS